MVPSETRKRRILIIDDDPALRRLIQLGLDRAGYETLTASHGGEAMTILGREVVDLLMVDLMMPVVDGLRFLRWLRQDAHSTTPALVFTSHTIQNIPADLVVGGKIELVRKPVKLPELLGHVNRLLNDDAGDAAIKVIGLS